MPADLRHSGRWKRFFLILGRNSICKVIFALAGVFDRATDDTVSWGELSLSLQYSTVPYTVLCMDAPPTSHAYMSAHTRKTEDARGVHKAQCMHGTN